MPSEYFLANAGAKWDRIGPALGFFENPSAVLTRMAMQCSVQMRYDQRILVF